MIVYIVFPSSSDLDFSELDASLRNRISFSAVLRRSILSESIETHQAGIMCGRLLSKSHFIR